MAVRPVNTEELELLVHGGHGHPHALLGPHVHEDEVTVRIFKPLAKTVTVSYSGP
jgi:1,4-alpha-glucan branching enzyme